MTIQGFQRPITVMTAIRAIRERSYLLPAIQRRFVWSHEKVEALFDSLMRGYPINSFMLWSITDPDVKKSVRFYDFLQTFRQYFKEQNAEFATAGHKDFFAVIDGQQRLTALFLGLTGSYAYKPPRVWWKDTEESLPTRHLYLHLTDRRPDDDEQGMVYDFSFLTAAEAPAKGTQSPWFSSTRPSIPPIRQLRRIRKKPERAGRKKSEPWDRETISNRQKRWWNRTVAASTTH